MEYAKNSIITILYRSSFFVGFCCRVDCCYSCFESTNFGVEYFSCLWVWVVWAFVYELVTVVSVGCLLDYCFIANVYVPVSFKTCSRDFHFILSLLLEPVKPMSNGDFPFPPTIHKT